LSFTASKEMGGSAGEPAASSTAEETQLGAGRHLEQHGVVVDLPDHAEDAADGHDLVPDLGRLRELLLRPRPALLGPDQQEVEDDADQKDREERDERIRGRLGVVSRHEGEVE
jgi:hypothetical protein